MHTALEAPLLLSLAARRYWAVLQPLGRAMSAESLRMLALG